MKKTLIYKTTLCAALVATTSSCVNNWLDLDPTTAVEASTAIQTTTDLYSTRAGLYAAVKGNSSLVDYYGRNMFIYGDIRGEDVQYNHISGSGRASFYYYMNYNTADDFGSTASVWQTPFIVMSRANRVLQAANSGNISDAEDYAAEITQYAAEARVLRSMALFDLTRIYGAPYTKDGGASLGAPIMYDVVDDPGTNKPERSTVTVCYDSIQTDLTRAIDSGALAVGNTPGYVNLWTAKALLLRVYMTKGEWAAALETAQDIITNSPYRLWTTENYAGAWSEYSAAHYDEVIFELVINGSTDNTDREGIAYCYTDGDTGSGYGDIMVTKSFSEMMTSDPEDVRNSILLQPVGKAEDYINYGEDFTTRGVYINKLPVTDGSICYANVPLLRLSEVYLSAAEAAFNLGDTSAAATLLNEIITNRTTDATKAVSADDITLDRIYIERRKELVGEGQRYFDVLRRGETVTRYTDVNDRGWHDVLNEDARTFNRDSKKALPLIPISEINANSNMQQNPSY